MRLSFEELEKQKVTYEVVDIANERKRDVN
jgi:hypothetical protein